MTKMANIATLRTKSGSTINESKDKMMLSLRKFTTKSKGFFESHEMKPYHSRIWIENNLQRFIDWAFVEIPETLETYIK